MSLYLLCHATKHQLDSWSFMDRESSSSIKKALEVSHSKGNDRLTKALLEALEDRQRDLKRHNAA
ncbi:hypothetical protein [Prochlorococcus marinus]|uniref:Uncharacterized protein n=1 Tax=Prochlorococcus marinus (strain MIT 9211) TaxID=93059 RepID=A9B9U0_PROM4|nr:hypothetical protein [Prochlorococcus marinus]ABX08602.1 Hypothetical protein P9211_06711 [Prochlorococcus marinus str. MIT 9211]